MNYTRILSLPREERQKLFDLLRSSLLAEAERTPIRKDSRGAELLDVMTDTLGEPVTAPRSERNTMARMMIAHQMKKEGFNEKEIAAVIQRDRTAVYALLKRMDNVFANGSRCRRELEIWKTFQTKLYNYDIQRDGLADLICLGEQF